MSGAERVGPFARAGLEDVLIPAIREAGAAALDVYARDFEVDRKADASPVTEADRRAEAILEPVLAGLAPSLPVVAEEAVSAGRVPDVRAVRAFWLVDPVDGTKEFVRRSGEWTVNIGLVVERRAVFGLIFAPVADLLYGGALGAGAWRLSGGGPRDAITARKAPAEGLTVISSRSHGDPDAIADLLRGHAVAGHATAGSSLKFCRLAEGTADVYPRYGPTSEWDTCAGQAILEAAGGHVADAETGEPFRYAKRPDFLNPAFIAWGMG